MKHRPLHLRFGEHLRVGVERMKETEDQEICHEIMFLDVTGSYTHEISRIWLWRQAWIVVTPVSTPAWMGDSHMIPSLDEQHRQRNVETGKTIFPKDEPPTWLFNTTWSTHNKQTINWLSRLHLCIYSQIYTTIIKEKEGMNLKGKGE